MSRAVLAPEGTIEDLFGKTTTEAAKRGFEAVKKFWNNKNKQAFLEFWKKFDAKQREEWLLKVNFTLPTEPKSIAAVVCPEIMLYNLAGKQTYLPSVFDKVVKYQTYEEMDKEDYLMADGFLVRHPSLKKFDDDAFVQDGKMYNFNKSKAKSEDLLKLLQFKAFGMVDDANTRYWACQRQNFLFNTLLNVIEVYQEDNDLKSKPIADIAASGCWNCGKGVVGELKNCARCNKAKYCSRECQTADWKGGHKEYCGKALDLRRFQKHKKPEASSTTSTTTTTATTTTV